VLPDGVGADSKTPLVTATQHVVAALTRHVSDFRLDHEGFSGRTDGVPVRGTMSSYPLSFSSESVLRVVVQATAARDATRLLLRWSHDEQRAAGLRTGAEDFDRVSVVEAAPNDLALAFLDERTRAGLLELARWGVRHFEVHEARVQLALDVEEKRDDGQLTKLSPEELETAVDRELAFLRDGCHRLSGLADSADRALLVQEAAPYRGPADFAALIERTEARERERKTLATRRARMNALKVAGTVLMLVLWVMLEWKC
jgi:hypothetical protein